MMNYGELVLLTLSAVLVAVAVAVAVCSREIEPPPAQVREELWAPAVPGDDDGHTRPPDERPVPGPSSGIRTPRAALHQG